MSKELLTVWRKGLRIVLSNNFSLGEIYVYFFHENCLSTSCVRFTESRFRGKFHLVHEKSVRLITVRFINVRFIEIFL